MNRAVLFGGSKRAWFMDLMYTTYAIYTYVVGCPTDLKTCSGDGLQGMYYMYGISHTKLGLFVTLKL